MKKRRRHWYRIYIQECPVGCKGRYWRERVYGRKPRDPAKRYVYDQVYDGCMDRGFV